MFLLWKFGKFRSKMIKIIFKLIYLYNGCLCLVDWLKWNYIIVFEFDISLF